MHALSVPCVVMAWINFYVALYYFFLFFKRIQKTEYLAFALLCVSTGCYDIFSAGLYNALSVGQGIFWQRLQLDSGIMIAMSLMWFTSIFTEHRGNRIIRAFIVWSCIILAVSFIVKPEFTLSAARPAEKHINFMNIFEITYYEGEVGIVYFINLITDVIAYIYVVYLFISYYKKAKYGILILTIIGQFTYFLGIINDILVAARIYSFIYIAEYMFTFIIISMALILLNQFANLQAAFEELNNRLEQKVQERTADLVKADNQLKNEIILHKKMEEKLKSSNRELEQFAYIASHDLQEPLRKIKIFGDLLSTNYGNVLDTNGRDYLQRMTNAATRMENFINDLLQYSRVTRGKPFTQVDLNIILNEVLVDLEMRINETKADIKTENLPVIEAEPLQMRQLFLNIIGNAIKYHRPDVPPVITITSELIHEDNHPFCEINIIDNGIGFDNQYAEKIFGLFQRLQGRGKYDGTGIGLPICKKIVEQHNGFIRASSRENEGSVFCITMPLKQNPVL